jgi:hypothetical protein
MGLTRKQGTPAQWERLFSLRTRATALKAKYEVATGTALQRNTLFEAIQRNEFEQQQLVDEIAA